MLEVINGVLLVYFVVLCTISALVPHFVKPIASCFNRRSNEERTIWTQLVELKAEQKKISMKDEFAAYSKIQRKINQLETSIKDNSQNRMSKLLAVKGSIHIGLQVLITLMILVSVFWFRREPLVVLKGNLFPLTSTLRYPSETPNAISTHVWVLISNVSIRCVLKPIFS